jgi:hypothetical protein
MAHLAHPIPHPMSRQNQYKTNTKNTIGPKDLLVYHFKGQSNQKIHEKLLHYIEDQSCMIRLIRSILVIYLDHMKQQLLYYTSEISHDNYHKFIVSHVIQRIHTVTSV